MPIPESLWLVSKYAKRQKKAANLLQGDKISLLRHVNCLQRSVQPRLYFGTARFLVVGICIIFGTEDLTRITQKNSSVTKLFDLVDRPFDLGFVFSGIELAINSVLDESIKQWIFGNVERRGLGVGQHR